jgi:hypothetical protein
LHSQVVGEPLLEADVARCLPDGVFHAAESTAVFSLLLIQIELGVQAVQE